jgi:hypothetical protein
LPFGNRRRKDLFDGRLILPQELGDDGIARLSLEIRAQKKTPARMLLGGLRAQPQEQT